MAVLDSEIQPFNIRVMDVDAFLKARGARPVTSLSIHEPSSVNFHADGLFSEEIFGQIGSPDRLQTFGYIELNATIIAPVLYKNLVKLSAFYENIMAGLEWAVWNPVTKTFERVYGDPEEVEAAGTGFSFFLAHFDELEFSESPSHVRENRIELLTRYRTVGLYKRVPVVPAGLRDVQMDTNRISQDDINKLYQSLLSYTKAIPAGAKSPLYDPIRFRIQKKVIEIYEYIENIMSGKRGFLQGAYGRRRLALGTRNVITASTYNTLTPDDPQALQPAETKVGLFQTMKGIQPLVVHAIKTALMDPVFGTADAARVALTNPETLSLEYVTLAPKEIARFVSTPAIEAWISRFKNPDVRALPITATATDGKAYHVCMIYDDGDEISLFRSLSDLEALRPGGVDRGKIRPLTWIEAFYLVTHNAVQGRHTLITRYPVIQDESCYPSRVHVTTTTPARVVMLRDLISGNLTRQYPQFPILANAFADSTIPHASKLKGLGADHDGDTVSANFTLTDEANAECAAYLRSLKSRLNPQKRFVTGGASDLITFMMINMTRA